MDPIQAQPVGDLELTSPASGSPPAEAEAPEVVGQQQFQEAGEKWMERLGVAEPEPEKPAARPQRQAGAPHPQDRLHHKFRERINRNLELRRVTAENQKQAALIERLSSFLSPLMEDPEEEPPALPELLDPATAEPLDFYNTVEQRQVAAMRAALDERLGPILPVLESMRQEHERATAHRQEVQQVVAELQNRQTALAEMEDEYTAAPEGAGYYERFAAYAQARIGFLVEQGFDPNAARQRVHMMMDGILQQSQQLPRGPAHPIAFLDAVIQHEMPQLAGLGRNGNAGRTPALPTRAMAPAAHPPPSRNGATATELRAAAASGAAGTLAAHGSATPKGGDIAAAVASGRIDPQKLKELIKTRHGGKLPANFSQARAELYQEIEEHRARSERQ